MKAKSIKGKSTEEIKNALAQSMADGYKPTMAFVFLTNTKEIDTISALLDAAGIAIFGASTSEKFSEDGIEPEGIVVMLLDMVPANFKIVVKDFPSGSVYDAACQVGETGAAAFKNPAFIITTVDFKTPGELIINGLLDKGGVDVTVIGGMAGERINFTGTIFTNHQRSCLLYTSFDQYLTGKTPSDLDRWKKGGLDVQIFSVDCDGGLKNAYAYANREMDSLDAVVARNPDKIVKVSNYAELMNAVKQHTIVAMFGVEGGHMIENDLNKLEVLYNRGARYLTLTHNVAPTWATSAADETTPNPVIGNGLNSQ